AGASFRGRGAAGDARRRRAANAAATPRCGRSLRGAAATVVMSEETANSSSNNSDAREPRLSRHSRRDSRAPRWRTFARASIPYVTVAAAGFTISYLVMSLVVFPGGLTPTETEI